MDIIIIYKPVQLSWFGPLQYSTLTLVHVEHPMEPPMFNFELVIYYLSD